MRVVHVAPTPFGAGGLFEGGERYPLEPDHGLRGRRLPMVEAAVRLAAGWA